MFYYISVIAFLTLAPMNIPVEEQAVIGPFPEKYQCEVYKAQVKAIVDSTVNAQIKTAKCITKIQSQRISNVRVSKKCYDGYGWWY